MPCYEPDDPRVEEKRRKLEEQAKQVDAMLCGLIQAVGIEYAMEKVNWISAGIDKAVLLKWWEEHCRRDDERTRQKR